ncbi:MAG TPA: type II toxin-antitoxin system HicA family toxin [Acetobacteraceae bacterium]
MPAASRWTTCSGSEGRGCFDGLFIHTSLHTKLKSVYLLGVNTRDVIRMIERAGWVHVASRGSHWQFTHPVRPGRVTVPHPKRDVPIGTLRSIERQAGVKLR